MRKRGTSNVRTVLEEASLRRRHGRPQPTTSAYWRTDPAFRWIDTRHLTVARNVVAYPRRRLLTPIPKSGVAITCFLGRAQACHAQRSQLVCSFTGIQHRVAHFGA